MNGANTDGERVVDPDVDGAEDVLDPGGGGVDLVEVGDVGGQAQRLAAGGFDVRGGAAQPGLAAGEQRDAVAARREGASGGASDARRWLR